MIEDFIRSTLASAAFSTAAIALLAFLFKGWIAERLKNAIKYEYDRDLENYKGMLVRVHTATAEGQKAAIERRMNAFDRIWKQMLDLKRKTGAFNFQYDIRTVQEWNGLRSNRDFVGLITSMPDAAIQELLGDLNIEEDRPYAGELVWALFFVYRSFNVRLIHLSKRAINNHSNINWLEDAPMRSMLAATLTSEEMKELDNLDIGKIDFVCRTIETKLLISWRDLISGVQLGEEALNHANSLMRAVNKPQK